MQSSAPDNTDPLFSNDWPMLADTADLPEHGKIVVSLMRWQSEAGNLGSRGEPVGVRLPNDTPIQALPATVLERPLLVLDFPGFADGRAYSQARQLRMRGYTGELRATGAAVVLDQIKSMLRCGINSFDLRPDQDAQACAAIVNGQA